MLFTQRAFSHSVASAPIQITQKPTKATKSLNHNPQHGDPFSHLRALCNGKPLCRAKRWRDFHSISCDWLGLDFHWHSKCRDF